MTDLLNSPVIIKKEDRVLSGDDLLFIIASPANESRMSISFSLDGKAGEIVKSLKFQLSAGLYTKRSLLEILSISKKITWLCNDGKIDIKATVDSSPVEKQKGQ